MKNSPAAKSAPKKAAGTASKSAAPAKSAAPSKSATSKSAATKTASKTATKSSTASKAPAKNAAPKSAPKNASSKAGKVSPKSDAASGLRELFEDELKDIYWAEKALTKALPKMAKNATDPELVAALQEHLTVTQEQVSRLEQVFEIVGKKAQAKKCEAMDGILKEADDIVAGTEPGVVRDAGIILACQKVEHYEIATYGTLTIFAKTIGEDEASDLLAETLAEEKDADVKLTELAVSSINVEAAELDEEDEDEDDDSDADADDEEEEEDEEA